MISRRSMSTRLAQSGACGGRSPRRPAAILQRGRAPLDPPLRSEARRGRLHDHGAEDGEAAALPRGLRRPPEPQDERERLWLRVQIICPYPAVAERSDIAEHRNAALEAEILQLRRDLRDAEGYATEIL